MTFKWTRNIYDATMLFSSTNGRIDFICRTKGIMAPNVTSTPTGVIYEGEKVDESSQIEQPKKKFVRQIVWRNVFIFVYLHLAAIYGLYLAFTSAKLLTCVLGKY